MITDHWQIIQKGYNLYFIINAKHEIIATDINRENALLIIDAFNTCNVLKEQIEVFKKAGPMDIIHLN